MAQASHPAKPATAPGIRPLPLFLRNFVRNRETGLVLVAIVAGLRSGSCSAWAIAQALELAPQLDRFGLAWLEEPIRADRPRQEWTQLREAIRFPLAAGENIASHAGFAEVLREPVLDVVQPDIAKWGGLSACASIARDILALGKKFCPHYLGAGGPRGARSLWSKSATNLNSY